MTYPDYASTREGFYIQKEGTLCSYRIKSKNQKQSEYQDAQRQLIILLKHEGFPSGEEIFFPRKVMDEKNRD
jgi:hypothetical protein